MRRFRLVRPAVLLAVLVPCHLAAQRLVLGHVAIVLLAAPLLAVTAFEAADRLAVRWSRRRAR